MKFCIYYRLSDDDNSTYSNTSHEELLCQKRCDSSLGPWGSGGLRKCEGHLSQVQYRVALFIHTHPPVDFT